MENTVDVKCEAQWGVLQNGAWLWLSFSSAAAAQCVTQWRITPPWLYYNTMTISDIIINYILMNGRLTPTSLEMQVVVTVRYHTQYSVNSTEVNRKMNERVTDWGVVQQWPQQGEPAYKSRRRSLSQSSASCKLMRRQRV